MALGGISFSGYSGLVVSGMSLYYEWSLFRIGLASID